MRLLLLILAVILPATGVFAEDLRTTDGTVYHRLKEVKAEPDGLVFVYDKGMAKVDFESLSPETQRRFGYDKQKAAAFRAHELAVVQGNQQIVREHEEQQLARIRKMMESGASANELIYSGSVARGTEARYAQQVQRQMLAKEEAAIAAARQPRTFWNAPFWQSPVVQVIGSIFNGSRSHGSEEGVNIHAGFDNHRGFSN